MSERDEPNRIESVARRAPAAACRGTVNRSRRNACALALAWVVDAPGARAEEARPLKLIVPAPPGAVLDNTARRIAHELSNITGALVVVENRPGGNMMIGADAVARSAPDGRTLLLGATSMAIAPLVQKDVSAIDALVPVMQTSVEGYGLVINPASSVMSLQDLERLAAARPDGLNCSTIPGPANIGCEQFKALVKGRMTTIPFAGAAKALEAVVGGHADLAFSQLSSLLPLVQGGRLRLLAVSSRDALPTGMGDVPLISDTWKGFFLEGFNGIYAPRGTPPERLKQLNRELNAAMRSPEVREGMRQLGQIPIGGSPERLDAESKRLQARYREIVQRLNISLDGR